MCLKHSDVDINWLWRPLKSSMQCSTQGSCLWSSMTCMFNSEPSFHTFRTKKEELRRTDKNSRLWLPIALNHQGIQRKRAKSWPTRGSVWWGRQTRKQIGWVLWESYGLAAPWTLKELNWTRVKGRQPGQIPEKVLALQPFHSTM